MANGGVEVNAIAGFDDASEGDLTFAALPKHIEKISDCKASVIVIPQNLKDQFEESNVIYSENPYYTFARILEVYYKPVVEIEDGVSPSAHICENVKIGKNCSVGPGVFIGKNSVIGDGTIIYPNTFIGSDSVIGEKSFIYAGCNIYHGSLIGSKTIIHSGCVIGSDGYGYTLFEGKHYKIQQAGNVCIGNEVEIGANVTIDRGSIGSTIIGEGCKIDNLVHIAHNVKIGRHSLIIAQVGVAGSAQIGDYVTLAGQAGVVGHVHIGSNSTVAARSVVTGDLPENSFVMGFPAKPHKEEKKIKAALRKLPELIKTIKNMKKSLSDIED